MKKTAYYSEIEFELLSIHIRRTAVVSLDVGMSKNFFLS